MTDAMLDFEAFGNGKNACVVQIGACYFDRYTGEIGNMFKINVDARTAVKSGADIDADTIYWWLAQSREAIDSVTKGEAMNIYAAFEHLNSFLCHAKQIWSHATYDFVILSETLKRLNISPLFHYRAARDIRTLIDLAKVTMKNHTREGTHHDALEDCKFQVKYCVEAFNKLSRKLNV